MKTKSKQSMSTCRHFDLFGQVPVLQSDLEVWIFTVAPRWYGNKKRMNWYIEQWNVAEKVAKAKVSGQFEGIEKAYFEAVAAFSAIHAP